MNASVRRYYRRRPLHSCYTHPSRMIYPPDERYSPSSPTPERETYHKFKPSQFGSGLPYIDTLSRDAYPHSESQ